jgi:hypothetical protein
MLPEQVGFYNLWQTEAIGCQIREVSVFGILLGE